MPYTAKGKCVYRKDTGKKVGCTKGSVKKYLAALHANVKDVNESEEFDWVPNEVDLNDHRVLYLIIEDNLKNSNFKIVKKGGVYHIEDEYGDIYFYISERDFNIPFIYHEIKDSIQFLKYEDDNEMLPYYQKLMSLLSPLYKNNMDRLFKPIKESEEWYDEVLNEKPLLRFDDLKVGDVLNNPDPVYQSVGKFSSKDLTYFHVLSFEDGTTWRNAYQEPEKYIVCNLVKEDSDTGNFIPYSRTDLKFPRGKNEPIWTLIYREGVIESINESEEFDWVENPVQYIKVGQRFNVKTSAEPITVQIVRIVEKPDFNRNTIYFSPINLVGTKYPGVPMNVQRLLTHINSGSWTPIKKINESEDDFEWAQETIKTSFLEFNGKEIMIDIQGLDTEELKRLYDIVIPYAQTDSSWFTTNEGEKIIWQDNTKCFDDISRNGVGKFKSISLHCGLEDNDYLPLKGAVCCLKGTYDDEPSYSKKNIIPINAREIIGGTINESEWFEDVVKDPIMLKVEDLEMGDIVIPTRFNQQEYIVTGKGTSVKLLDTPTHWVTLKRNTKENTGGVFIEHDSEIGKACRFELIHREENLNESEEDSELFWVEDLLKGAQESVDITDKLDIMEELPVDAILKVTGYQDEMELYNEEVKLIDKAEDQNYQSTYYLFKLKKERHSDGTEMTHCGQTKHNKICECREGTDDDLGQTEVGKCWWIELKKQDKVIYYPNRIDLTENKKKKPLLTEGRYDAITRKVVRDIMKAVTEGNSDSYNLPLDISKEQDEYEQDNLSFSLELDIIRTDEVDSFEVKTAIADDEENIIMMSILMGPNFSSQKLQSLFYKLQEDIRHEIEHFTQMGPNRIKDRPTYRGSTANLKTTYGHHKNVIEVPALVHGFYRRAKLEKRPIDEIMMDDLDAEIERGLLTKTQAQKLLTLWISYAKKNLPAAVYKKD